MSEPTIQLYNQDSHKKTFEAKVLTCINQSDGNNTYYIVTLDATAFFPEGGGQPSDTGILGGVQVLDVQEDDGIIYHKLTASLNVGETVTGEIDWIRRFDLMQHHTAEHIISGLVHKYYGYDNVGFHMGSEAITIDFNGILTETDIRKIELMANQAVYENVPVTTTVPEAYELKTMNYRCKKEIDGDIRIVTIAGYDTCACCAPHVSLTGEIGCIKITSCQKYKGGVRISMLCGNRALQDYNKRENSVSEISVLLSAKPDEVQEAVKILKADNQNLKNRIISLQNQILKLKASVIADDTENICIFDNEIEPDLLRFYGNLLTERCKGICAVFTSETQEKHKYILASKNLDVRSLGKELNESFQGKGGGTKEMVQGFVMGSQDQLEKFVYTLFNNIQ